MRINKVIEKCLKLYGKVLDFGERKVYAFAQWEEASIT